MMQPGAGDRQPEGLQHFHRLSGQGGVRLALVDDEPRLEALVDIAQALDHPDEPTEAHRSKGLGITGTRARSAIIKALCGTAESAAGGQSMTMKA